MKRLYFRRAWFGYLAVLLGFHWCIIWCHEHIVMTQSFVSVTERQFSAMRADGPIEVLVLGDSHSEFGVDTNVIRNSFNYGVGASAYHQTYYQLNEVLHTSGNAIQSIVLSFDLAAFGKHPLNFAFNDHYWVKYVDYLDLALRSGQYLAIFGQVVRAKFLPYTWNRIGPNSFLRFIDVHVLKTGVDDSQRMYRGYFPRFQSMWNLLPGERRMSAKFSVTRDFRDGAQVDPVSLEYFRMIVELCNEYDIRVFLVRFPMSHEYLEFTGRLPLLDEFNESIQSLLDDYPEAVFLDFEDLFPKQSGKFVDPHHLSSRGAREFSRQLSKDIERYR